MRSKAERKVPKGRDESVSMHRRIQAVNEETQRIPELERDW